MLVLACAALLVLLQLLLVVAAGRVLLAASNMQNSSGQFHSDAPVCILLVYERVCVCACVRAVIDVNDRALRGLGGLAATFGEVAHVSMKVLRHHHHQEQEQQQQQRQQQPTAAAAAACGDSVACGDADASSSSGADVAYSNGDDDDDVYHNRRIGIASSDRYWLKFATGALQYFFAPEVLKAVWGPGGAAWNRRS